MKISIRVDATPAIGTGHVVRCLSLAMVLRAEGNEVSFLAASMPDHLVAMIQSAGIPLILFPQQSLDHRDTPWSIAEQIADASAVIANSFGADWVVVDSYALGLPFEEHILAAGVRLLVIDDLGRQHQADLLLDQTLHRNAAGRYDTSVIGRKLFGPRHALLRQEFAAGRSEAKLREGPARRLMVMMSGSDAGDSINLMLDAIEQAGISELGADIVVTSAHPSLAQLRQRCALNPAWVLHVDSNDVATLMAKADLAIGAGGSATWERACLGLPTLAICLADNQKELLREASAAGLLVALPSPYSVESVVTALHLLTADEGLRHHMSAQGLSLVDGAGARRVAAAMRGALMRVRPATLQDSAELLEWRNRPEVRQASRSTQEISPAEHETWLARILGSDTHWLLVGEYEGIPVGVVRFDQLTSNKAEVSIYMTGFAHPGDGSGLLAAAESWLERSRPEIATVVAEFRAGNIPSQALFANAGYLPTTVVTEKRL